MFCTLMICRITIIIIKSISSQIESTRGAYFDTFAYVVNGNIQENLGMLNQPVDRNQ